MGMTKQTEKAILWGVAIGGGLLLLKLAKDGIGGTVRDITGGVIGGVVDAATGAVIGAYTAIPDAIKPSSNQNVIYQGANAVVRTLPGTSSDETLGGFLAEYPSPFDYFKKLIGG